MKKKKGEFDLEDWPKQISENVAKRRIPQIEIPLSIIDIASEVLGYEPGRVSQDGESAHERVQSLLDDVKRAADFYEKIAVNQAMRPSKRGRPPEQADIAFIFAIAISLQNHGLTFHWRCWNAEGGAKEGKVGGREEETAFQQICNVLLKKPRRMRSLWQRAAASSPKRRRAASLSSRA